MNNNILAKLMVSVQGKVIDDLDFPQGASLVIGRGNNVNYQIKSGALSRRHCQIIDIGCKLHIKDLNSLNGTYVNRQKISEMVLKTGDEVQIGPIVVKVQLMGQAAHISSQSSFPPPNPNPTGYAPSPPSGFPQTPQQTPQQAPQQAPYASSPNSFPNPNFPAPTGQPFPPPAPTGSSFPSAPPSPSPFPAPTGQPFPPPTPTGSFPPSPSSFPGSPPPNPGSSPGVPKPTPHQVTQATPLQNRPPSHTGGGAKPQPPKPPGREETPIFRANDYPTGPCKECKKDLAQKDMSSHMGVFKGNDLYCLQCFSEGAGNFPTIAGYRIIKKLGGGGMGDVYESIQLSMERPVAFKLMRSLENASEQQVKRFFREARTGGKLNHSNIVGFIDSGKLEGACYIAMEFIYGRDVRHIMEEQGPIDFEEALRIAYYVAKALDYATTRFNIVHRDIKPENILIDRDNVIKLTDFGLAKNLEEAGLSGITKSQTGVGTLFYMAPEQITDARFADKRADIYSLGVTLYEMITGERPFFATQMMPLVNKIRYEQPRPIPELVPHILPEVVAMISRAMEKEPKDRFQTPGEMMKSMEAIIPIP